MYRVPTRTMMATALVTGLLSAAATAPASAIGTDCLPSVIKTRLEQVRKRFGPVQIVSAYRPGATIRGSGNPSHHASCRAVDFIPPKGKYDEVADWLESNHNGGVGTYTCMKHIHIDNGSQMRWEKCR